jgi:hypothetical protein
MKRVCRYGAVQAAIPRKAVRPDTTRRESVRWLRSNELRRASSVQAAVTRLLGGFLPVAGQES